MIDSSEKITVDHDRSWLWRWTRYNGSDERLTFTEGKEAYVVIRVSDVMVATG